MSGYNWVTEILVWGYAPTRESVISHILSHTMARRGHGLRSLPWTFTERAPRSTWWRTSRPITSRSSRCCRRIQPAPTSSARSRIQDTGRGRPGARGMHVNAPRPFASVLIPFMEGGRSGVRGYALSGGHQTVHSVWGYACRAFRSPNHTLTPTYSKSRDSRRKIAGAITSLKGRRLASQACRSSRQPPRSVGNQRKN